MTSLPFTPTSPWLAPLAGWSDLPFRLLCRRLGAGVCCTEMVSAKGMVYGGRNTEELLVTCPEDLPLVVQIFGAEAEFMERAVHLLKERGFSWFDVNMGCSVPKVTKTFSGAAMLKDMENSLRVARAVIQASGGKAGFKIRLDWEAGYGGTQEDICHELATRLQQEGAAWITLHPRYAKQGFTGQANHSVTKRLAEALSIPLIASGDLFRAEDAKELLENSRIATVMYARGALNNPAIFAEHMALFLSGSEHEVASNSDGRAWAPTLAGYVPCPSSHEKVEKGEAEDTGGTGDSGEQALRRNLFAIIRAHAELAREWAPRTALLKMRTIVPRYVKGLDGAKALRQKLITCTDWKTLDNILEEEFGRSL